MSSDELDILEMLYSERSKSYHKWLEERQTFELFKCDGLTIACNLIEAMLENKYNKESE